MSPPDPNRSQNVGPHHITIEGAVIHIRLNGDFTESEIAEILNIIGEMHKREGCVFSLNDINNLRSVTPDARRYTATWMRTHPFEGGAIYGGSLATRVVMTLLIRAINLIRHEQILTVFCETEQEARAWIAVQLQNHRRATTPPGP